MLQRGAMALRVSNREQRRSIESTYVGSACKKRLSSESVSVEGVVSK